MAREVKVGFAVHVSWLFVLLALAAGYWFYWRPRHQS